MLLLDYWPDFLRGLLEFMRIAQAQQPEFDAVKTEMSGAVQDFFIISLSEYGISRWESIFNIVPAPSVEPLNFRRQRILNRMTATIPYTERMLQKLMDSIMGQGNWSYTLDHNNYRLDITSLHPDRNWLGEMQKTLRVILPANIMYFLHFYAATWGQVYAVYDTWGDVFETGITWREIMEETYA